MKDEQIVADEIDPRLATLAEARAAVVAAQTGTLSVIDFETGGPFGALVNVATSDAGTPVLLLSRLSRHVKCLDANAASSLMLRGAIPEEGDPLTGLRATITGTLTRSEEKGLRARYLARHPYAELYVDFGDFDFWVLQPAKVYVVAGFGRIVGFSAAEFFS